MTAQDLRSELNLVEAQLFANDDCTVIRAIDQCADEAEATSRLREFGMTQHEAAVVLAMPLKMRTMRSRTELLQRAQALRVQVEELAEATQPSDSQ